MATGNSRSIMKITALLLVGIFVLSLGTVEMHQSRLCSWLTYPGFLEADSEKALAENHAITSDVSEAIDYFVASSPDIFLEHTTLFLHVYRGPPPVKS
jgi:hypothetical protein